MVTTSATDASTDVVCDATQVSTISENSNFEDLHGCDAGDCGSNLGSRERFDRLHTILDKGKRKR